MHRILVCLGNEGPIRRICLKYEWRTEYQERVFGSGDLLLTLKYTEHLVSGKPLEDRIHKILFGLNNSVFKRQNTSTRFVKGKIHRRFVLA